MLQKYVRSTLRASEPSLFCWVFSGERLADDLCRPFPPGWDITNHGSAQKQKIALYQQYKFVLAFENYNLTDYVTEKLPTAYLGLLRSFCLLTL